LIGRYKVGEGFTSMSHWIGLYILFGLFTQRTVYPVGVLYVDWSSELQHGGAEAPFPYCPSTADRHDWFCMFNTSLAKCDPRVSTPSCKDSPVQMVEEDQEYGYRFVDSVGSSLQHTAQLRSAMRIEVAHPQDLAPAGILYTPTGVDLQKYVEMGNFWLLSAVQYWLWRLRDDLNQMISNHAVSKSLTGKRYIGMHIRHTDNKDAISLVWGLKNAYIPMDKFLKHAEAIRQQHPDVNTIFLATDSDFIVSQMEQMKPNLLKRGWTIVLNEDAFRSNATQGSKLDWFVQYRQSMGFDIVLDVDTLKRADFLIGSMISNVFRLGVELNHAHRIFLGTDQDCTSQRYYSVDVPWYADP